jgi:hypothetical protein
MQGGIMAANIDLQSRSERIAIFVFGTIFVVALIGLAVIVPEPKPFQYTVFRIVLALAAAGVAALVPGFIQVQHRDAIRAGGALAVFVIVYFFSPAALVVEQPDGVRPSDTATSAPATTLTGESSRGPLPNIVVSSCVETDWQTQTKTCTDVGSFPSVADGPFRIHGGYIDNKSEHYTYLFLKVSECEKCRLPRKITLLAATQSSTECELDVRIDPNKINKFNKTIYRKLLDTRETIEIPIEDPVKNGDRTFQLSPNPNGCDLVLTSLMLQ